MFNLQNNDELKRRLLRLLIMGLILYLYLTSIEILPKKEIINIIIVILVLFMLIDIYIPHVILT